jgi:hypothetical protein
LCTLHASWVLTHVHWPRWRPNLSRHWNGGDLTRRHALIQHRHDRTLLGELGLALRVDLAGHCQLRFLGSLGPSLGLLGLSLRLLSL